MSEAKPLRLGDLNEEELECLADPLRRAEAHRMLDDLEARCGYDAETIRATLPPRGAFREIVESYTFMTEVGTGGNCTAVRIPCEDGTYLLITDLNDPVVPADDAEVVLVGRYTEGDNEPADITRDLPASKLGPREVRTGDLQHVIDTALGFTAAPSRPAGRGAGAACERAPDRPGVEAAQGPYRVEIDQASHGCQLAIVDAAGEVLARTPECGEFGAPEQARDWRNAAELASAWTMREALQEIESLDWRRGIRHYHSEVIRTAREALQRARDMEQAALGLDRKGTPAQEVKTASPRRPHRPRSSDLER